MPAPMGTPASSSRLNTQPALPRRPMDNTRTMARRELVEYVNRNHRRDGNFFFEEWIRPETRAVLEDVMKQLKERKKKPN